MKKNKFGLISCAMLTLMMCIPCYARSTDDYLKEITEINRFNSENACRSHKQECFSCKQL